jgi:hypothetical protein
MNTNERPTVAEKIADHLFVDKKLFAVDSAI